MIAGAALTPRGRPRPSDGRRVAHRPTIGQAHVVSGRQVCGLVSPGSRAERQSHRTRSRRSAPLPRHERSGRRRTHHPRPTPPKQALAPPFDVAQLVWHIDPLATQRRRARSAPRSAWGTSSAQSSSRRPAGREFLDRTLIWNQAHLHQMLHQYEAPQSAPAAQIPAWRRAAEAATRACRSRPLPRPKTRSRRWPDQRVSPGRMTWTRFSARTTGIVGLPGGQLSHHVLDRHVRFDDSDRCRQWSWRWNWRFGWAPEYLEQLAEHVLDLLRPARPGRARDQMFNVGTEPCRAPCRRRSTCAPKGCQWVVAATDQNRRHAGSRSQS